MDLGNFLSTNIREAKASTREAADNRLALRLPLVTRERELDSI